MAPHGYWLGGKRPSLAATPYSYIALHFNNGCFINIINSIAVSTSTNTSTNSNVLFVISIPQR